MADNEDSSSSVSVETCNALKIEGEIPAELVDESDSELDIAINEELIRKTQEEITKRISTLTTLITGLKETLKNERALWKQEIEQVIVTQNYYMTHALCYANTCCSSDWYDPFDSDRFNSQKEICSSGRYDENLQIVNYHSDLRNRRLNITNYHRNLAIENYKNKLLEVESLCTMELNRVQSNVQSLQLLQQVAAEWDQASGDAGSKSSYNNKLIQSPENENTAHHSGDFTPTSESPRASDV